jgi:Protein of unknown function (DUF2510)
MPEFTAVSSADPSALVNELNAHATNGWEVVSVVESGGRVHAIMRREGAPPAAVKPSEAAASAPAAVVAAAPAEVVAPAQAEPVAVTPIESAQPVAASAAAASAPSNATVAITHTPAGWYPDPSGRFEMRYWDGLAWTEHVSRQGQQFTDPPTA